MATPSPDGRKYVRLTVDIWYDAGTKRVHLNSSDPDLPKTGLATDFKPGTQADRNARALLARFGKLPDGV
ncbi:hypothetical protein OG943_07470 [Amycolatopsis sp. NBC_00345]|uniref:hypothetical protein n=1 Tax=Amycolatopsis sp. NBC_00345 TaxID=2975955 RepID=UPI002E258AC9